MQLTIKQKIVLHVCYRQIFNAPVRISECRKWLAIENHNEEEFESAIQELQDENLIDKKDGFISTKENNEIIDLQPEKEKLSKELLEKGEKKLLLLSKLPFIQYIGISGSVAAKNPTLLFDRKGRGSVDLDIFIICKSHCLWPFFLIERVLMNIKSIFKGHHFYCFNYVTEETFLEVYNKNFYTATEITNLHTIYDGGVFDSFIEANAWSEKYYPKRTLEHKGRIRTSLWTLLVAPFNFICYALFCLGRAIKRKEINPIFEMFSAFNPIQKCNLKRISNPNGGYQEVIKEKFIKVFNDKFPDYYSIEIMDDLFPPSNAFAYMPEDNVYNKEFKEIFSKYNV